MLRKDATCWGCTRTQPLVVSPDSAGPARSPALGGRGPGPAPLAPPAPSPLPRVASGRVPFRPPPRSAADWSAPLARGPSLWKQGSRLLVSPSTQRSLQHPRASRGLRQASCRDPQGSTPTRPCLRTLPFHGESHNASPSGPTAGVKPSAPRGSSIWEMPGPAVKATNFRRRTCPDPPQCCSQVSPPAPLPPGCCSQTKVGC